MSHHLARQDDDVAGDVRREQAVESEKPDRVGGAGRRAQAQEKRGRLAMRGLIGSRHGAPLATSGDG